MRCWPRRSNWRQCEMRVMAAIAGIVLVSTAGAQGFEGVVTYQTGKNGETWQYSEKAGKVRIDVNDAHMPGGAAMLFDTGTDTMMMLLPAQKMYMTMDMSKTVANIPDSGGRGKVTKIGS